MFKSATWICWLILLTSCLDAHSAEIIHSKIKFVGRAYLYEFQVNINAPLEATRQVVTDYNNIEQINDGVVDSKVLEIYDDHTLKRRLWIEYCMLVFCFDLLFVENVQQTTENEIVTTVIPEESNFKRGTATWTLTALSDNRTEIKVIAEQEPDFWIPPVVGPPLMRSAFLKEIKETTEKIEQAARNLSP